MTFTMTHYSTNIVVVGFLPPITKLSHIVRDSRAVQNQIASMVDRSQLPFWCIYDFSDVDLDYDHLVMMVTDQTRKAPGSFTDNRVQFVGVVNDSSMAYRLDHFLALHKINLPLFERCQNAVEYVNQQNYAQTL